MFGACSGNLLVGAQLRRWQCRAVLLLCAHCPSSSLLCCLRIILQWSMDSMFVLLLCIPKGIRVFGLVISWLCVYSSPEVPVISPWSSSPLFPIKVIKKTQKGRAEIRRIKSQMVPHSRHVPASSFCHWNAKSSLSAIEPEISWARGATLSLAYTGGPQCQHSINIHSWF